MQFNFVIGGAGLSISSVLIALMLFLFATPYLARGTAKGQFAGYAAVGAGVVLARAAFVWEMWDAYAPEPWSILDLRQGGFNIWAGIAGAIATILILAPKLFVRRAMLATIVGLAIVHLALSVAAPRKAEPMPTGLIVSDLRGVPTSLASLKGRPYVINLWATWCPPCRREMPMLVDAAQRSDLPILLLNVGEDAERVRQYLNEAGLPDTAVRLDPLSHAGAALDGKILPTTLFIDSDGQIQHRHVGEISRAMLYSGMKRIQ